MTKITKYTWIAALAVAAWIGSTTDAPAAQKADKAGKRAAARDNLKDMAQELNLTAEQKEKLKPILKEAAGKVRETRQDSALSRKEKAQQLRKSKDEIADQVKPILTPEQFEKWNQLRTDKLAAGGKQKKNK